MNHVKEPGISVAFSRRVCARALRDVCPSEARGRRECRVQAAPMARQQQKKLAAVTTGSARSSGIPCAMVLTLITRSPWGPGFLAPIIGEIISRQLGISVGMPGPHAFAVRISAVRPHESSCAPPKRPSQPRLTFADDWPQRPLSSRRDGRIILLIYGITQAGYFCPRGWTGMHGYPVICPSGRASRVFDHAIALRRHASSGPSFPDTRRTSDRRKSKHANVDARAVSC
jgi:hypothetical protein